MTQNHAGTVGNIRMGRNPESGPRQSPGASGLPPKTKESRGGGFRAAKTCAAQSGAMLQPCQRIFRVPAARCCAGTCRRPARPPRHCARAHTARRSAAAVPSLIGAAAGGGRDGGGVPGDAGGSRAARSPAAAGERGREGVGVCTGDEPGAQTQHLLAFHLPPALGNASFWQWAGFARH